VSRGRGPPVREKRIEGGKEARDLAVVRLGANTSIRGIPPVIRGLRRWREVSRFRSELAACTRKKGGSPKEER